MKPRGGEGQNGRLKCPTGFLVLNGFMFSNTHSKMTLQILDSLLPRDNPEKVYAVLLYSFHYRYKLGL